MANQDKLEDLQPYFTSFVIGDEAIKGRLLAAKEELLREGVITRTIGDKLEQFTREADLGVRIRVPRDLLSAKLVKVEQIEDFSWTNSFFEILLALATCFLGAFLGYLTTAFRFDFIAGLLLIFSVILIGLTTYLLLRRNTLMKGMLDEEKFVSIVERGLGLDLTRPKT